MEEKNKTCSYEKHKEEISNYYCKNCNIYMCNKCFEYHSKLFENHFLIKNDQDNPDIFTGYCNEKNHFEVLEFFCKNHNKLCCSSCICKMKSEKYGEHKDCDICFINDIKEEKKNKLKENIKILEDILVNIKESLDSIKLIYEKMNEKKENLKINVQKVFTKIRSEINNREDQLLSEIEQMYDKLFIKEELIKEREKLPNKIKLVLEKGKRIIGDLDNENKTSLIINDCINIENNIKNVNEINDSIYKFNNNEVNIYFYPQEEKFINSFLEDIRNFGKINMELKLDFLQDSKIINKNNEYIKSLQNWINPENKHIKTVLLYRLSDHGEEISKFHELCDNKGPTLTLFHTNDDNKVGIFTTLSWDSITDGWKEDNNVFIFNLNQDKKYKNIRTQYSIYCKKNYGPYTDYFGINKTMKSLFHDAYRIFNTYENGRNILPSNSKEKYYGLSEVEIFKVSFKN